MKKHEYNSNEHKHIACMYNSNIMIDEFNDNEN